jgi:ribosomal protein L37AE/L43A
MDKLQKNWFERLQINFNQAPEGYIGIHAWKAGTFCVYFEVPQEWADSEDFWGLVYERARKEWAIGRKGKYVSICCPVCKRTFWPFKQRYKGVMFCNWCGSYYKLDGYKVTIIRSILDV